MIQAKDLFNINFYKSSPFFGSYRGLHYKIEKYAEEEEASQPLLRVWTWPGPYIFAVTPDTEKRIADFPFSNDGLEQIAAYLNEVWAAAYQSS